VSETVFDLGGCDRLGKVYSGSFVISNLTDALPTEFELTSSLWITLSQAGGRLDERKIGEV
jgi:hypothetical protein